ncbi:MAG: glycoside-pentoside-hexuronide (GPH):cation symporter [Levilactobacillus sp.]|nr:glycoside-pentoside-hexuronide (GPH):cation symporter [Levilactobacillus sp.]MCI1553152.1 glycoside-pentoside-hexuronide (GPH):cation symporter [Levilactobacillus sp.]MCI1599288.1 glycoside-pentoside-hexuronide (GPH):cation symporter [Levilactobacillus sp.]MCI1605151.1 glycoside-pentoside-hexuronide (GPH):cation symporter [Levilactobacillus sp.]
MLVVKKYISYALGTFGHDAFYNTLSIYFMMFLTSQLFTNSGDEKMVGIVTTMVVVIRVGEIMFDPMIGGIVDNTNTRWGKFRPWIMIGSVVAAIGLVFLFSDYFGLAWNSPIFYLVLVAITFLMIDVFYSFSDIALWSMLPAVSLDNRTRTKFGTASRIGSTLGAQIVIVIITPAILLFSHLISKVPYGQQTRAGWTGYVLIVALLCVGGALITCLNIKEEHNLIRANVKHTTVSDIFRAIGHNKQLLWMAASYFLFAFSYVVTNSLLMYYFTYRLGNAAAYTWVGVITCILGVISVGLFPTLETLIHRRAIYIGGIAFMLVGYVIFLLAGQNLGLVLLAVSFYFFPYPLIFLATLMTITDSVEYGQLVNGVRNESVTLSVRPLIDKLAGAASNGIVGIVAVVAGMTGNAKPSDITAAGVSQFNLFMFYIPIVLLILAALLFYFKVDLTEAKHQKIVAELQKRLKRDQTLKEADSEVN